MLKVKSQNNDDSLPSIPEKRYFTISEAAFLCAVKPHVLRYWEQEFLQLKPSKRRGNRRFYQKKDVVVVRQIRKLLYENGFTIEGARTQLLNNSSEDQLTQIIEPSVLINNLITDLEAVLQDLKMNEA